MRRYWRSLTPILHMYGCLFPRCGHYYINHPVTMLDHYDMYLLSLCLREERCGEKRAAWRFAFLPAGVLTFAELAAYMACSSLLHRVSFW